MIEVARLPDDQRRELFRNTADKMGLNDAIIEKDFWVCFTLDHLFHHSSWKKVLAFKGGTSLSKAFNLIQRFSEDIDLILDWRVLGFSLNEPWEKRSNTKQDAFNKAANARAEAFLAKEFCPSIKSGLSLVLGQEANVYIDKEEGQTVIFAYPTLFSGSAALRAIRLEMGAGRMDTSQNGRSNVIFCSAISSSFSAEVHCCPDSSARENLLGEGNHPPP